MEIISDEEAEKSLQFILDWLNYLIKNQKSVEIEIRYTIRKFGFKENHNYTKSSSLSPYIRIGD